MNIQDLSLEELKICSLLYSTPNSILRPLEIILCELFGVKNLKVGEDEMNPLEIALEAFLGVGNLKVKKGEIRLQRNAPIREGQWHEKLFYTAPQVVIQSLLDRKLLLAQEEDSQKFYILNKCKEFKEFFKELKVQIALGSIHYNPDV